MPFTAFLLSSGATTKLVAASSSTSVVATQVCTGGEQGMFLTNPTSVPVYLAVGTSAVLAAQPSTSTPQTGLCLPSGATRPISVPGTNSGWLSAVTSAGTGLPGVLATPGFYGS